MTLDEKFSMHHIIMHFLNVHSTYTPFTGQGQIAMLEIS